MPELPDVEVYVEALRERVVGHPLERARLASPFVLRTVDPSLREVEGKQVVGVRRLGKRIVFDVEGDLHLVIHLMIAGRFRWRDRGAPVPGKVGLLAFDFETGTLLFTEASPKKRASLHVVRGEEAVQKLHRGGLEVLDASFEAFVEALTKESHTLKRALTDPRLFSGIGNAYSDEILHRAKLSPAKLAQKLLPDELRRLFEATRAVLVEWTQRLRDERAGGFPEKVTAFREGMAVHGRYRQPCPACGTKVQRIAYADNETNYCPRCQTEGRLLSDRSLARLLKDDWPRTIEELEEKMAGRAGEPSKAPKAQGKSKSRKPPATRR
jgi:formamidopyrimidine-DNA glycosylase